MSQAILVLSEAELHERRLKGDAEYPTQRPGVLGGHLLVSLRQQARRQASGFKNATTHPQQSAKSCFFSSRPNVERLEAHKVMVSAYAHGATKAETEVT